MAALAYFSNFALRTKSEKRLLGSLPKSGTSDLVVTTCMMRLRASLTRSPPRFDFSANFIKPALRGAHRSKASRPVGLVGISAAREFISPPPDAKKAQTGIAVKGKTACGGARACNKPDALDCPIPACTVIFAATENICISNCAETLRLRTPFASLRNRDFQQRRLVSDSELHCYN